MRRRLDDLRSGSGVYLCALIDALNGAGFRVRVVLAPISAFGSLAVSRPSATIAARGCEVVWPDTLRLGRLYVSMRSEVWLRMLRRARAQLGWLLRGRRGPRPSRPSDVSEPPVPVDAAALAAEANAVASRLVVAEYSSLAPCLARCRADHRAVLLHDLMSRRSRSFRRAGLDPDHVDVPPDDEIGWLAPADLCIYVSPVEQAAFAPRLPGKTHVTFRLPICPRTGAVRAGGPVRAVFIGVRHGGNRDALDAILGEIWPRAHAACPEAELWIVGEIGEDVRRPLPPGVRVLGRLDDLDPVGGPDAIGLAPARAASGVSIKVGTYLELGMAALATSIALEGFAGTLGGAVRATDSIEAFTVALIELLRDREARHALAAKGLQARRPRDAEMQRLLASMAETPATASPSPPPARPAT
ncbi:glycosyltransferase family 4 protein [Jannaschia sp. W003]|uniref:glycosyltransferase family 4 protein n=1 Tax=Jannaschia sp. W003 TaxID=2867012 RepID=UPI0021A40EE3|nr:glycosyltransferase family 4 protein [Jannaschia sp. W003]UWQ21588.1 glycosyltransferase family 4 protein [Jannaschia sp. W003]